MTKEFHSLRTHSQNLAIQNAVMPMCFSCDDTVVTTTVTVKGTSYKKGLYVPLEHTDAGLLFGELVIVLVCKHWCLQHYREGCKP